jgi:hypothetical protein
MKVIKQPGLQWVVSLLELKTWIMLVTYSLPDFNLKELMSSSCEFHVDDRSESSSTYDMIIGNVPRSPWRIRHNHELQ